MEAVQELGAKAALLDMYQLDIIESRLATLIHKMDNIQQKKVALALDSEHEQKVNWIFLLCQLYNSTCSIQELIYT